MANDAQKNWLQDSLNRFGQKKAIEAIQLTGKALPCSVAAIPVEGVPVFEVKFEVNAAPFTLPNVVVACAGSEYVRLPIVVGCKGVLFPLDVFSGGVTGIGTGTADLSPQANLASLIFFPVGNKGWEASEAPAKIVLYGPDGAILRTADKATFVDASADGVEIKVPLGKSLVITSLPTSPAGLGSGALYRDVGTGNVKAVP